MKIETQFCVVGGGMAGLCAAVAAARHGVKTVLIQDRPVLGGNASSEIRMHICGAHGSNRREGGILEEILLDNFRYNSGAEWTVFDHILWAKATREPNLTLLLDTSVNSCEMSGSAIKSVRGWRTTTQDWIEVESKYFADCSGDSILAPLCGAAYRAGREGRAEFGESEAPLEPDSHTMGNSILFQAEECTTEQPFTPFPWAYDYSDPNKREWLYGRWCNPVTQNFWWIEVGGMGDCIKDTAEHRTELLKIAYGVWDFMKNHADDREKWKNWRLGWIGSLPGKRESRRYEGDHILTQQEVQAGGIFGDVVAYGGWKIDNHYPEGFYHRGEGTKYTNCPSPFGIPFRCLYSKNIPNLMFAGRNISCSHVAMSATRVMATCALEGQAIGTAAAIAVKERMDPRDIAVKRVKELQEMLREDDCWIPGTARTVRGPCANAKISATAGSDAETLRDGVDRTTDDGDHAWEAPLGAAAEYRFAEPEELREARLVFDSWFNRHELNRPLGNPYEGLRQGRFFRGLNDTLFAPPHTLVKDFRIETLAEDGKTWRVECEVKDNFQRLVRVPLNCRTKAVRLVPLSTWGADLARIYGFEVH